VPLFLTPILMVGIDNGPWLMLHHARLEGVQFNEHVTFKVSSILTSGTSFWKLFLSNIFYYLCEFRRVQNGGDKAVGGLQCHP
jgi:hypothetical protein